MFGELGTCDARNTRARGVLKLLLVKPIGALSLDSLALKVTQQTRIHEGCLIASWDPENQSEVRYKSTVIWAIETVLSWSCSSAHETVLVVHLSWSISSSNDHWSDWLSLPARPKTYVCERRYHGTIFPVTIKIVRVKVA